jgi:hypothetical protein
MEDLDRKMKESGQKICEISPNLNMNEENMIGE